MSGEMLALVVAIIGLSVAIIGLIVGIVVFWYKMADLLKIVSGDIKQMKKETYAHVEVENLFHQKMATKAEKVVDILEGNREVCGNHERKLERVSESLANQQTVLGYMEKVFEEIKRLVDSNTQVARDIKLLLERGYGGDSNNGR